MMQPGFNINDLVQEAQIRWLKPVEVLFILQNYENHQIAHEPPQKPTGGSLFLYNKRALRFFRRDGHSWRKKKDGRTVGEAHERLKVGNVEALNCYYAHGEQNSNFQRRSYWMLDPAYEHIVLVHYREIIEGKNSSATISHLSTGSSFTLSPSPSPSPYVCIAKNPNSNSAITDLYDSNQNFASPGSVEVSSNVVINNARVNQENDINETGQFHYSCELEVTQALRQLEEQLSLDDDSLKEIGPFDSQNGNLNNFGVREHERVVATQDTYLQGREKRIQCHIDYAGTQHGSDNIFPAQDGGDNDRLHQSFRQKSSVESKESLYWKEMSELPKSLSEKQQYTMDINQEKHLVFSSSELYGEQKNYSWLHHDSVMLPQETENLNAHEINLDYYTTFNSNILTGMPFEENSSLTIAQTQKFTIRCIAPEWGYAPETTKVIIIGSFLCDPSESVWSCLIGDTEVPLQIIQDGVLFFQAPPHIPGNVTLCITSGNWESCSEIKEFEYRSDTTSSESRSLPLRNVPNQPDELLLLVRFVHMLLSDPVINEGDGVGLKTYQLKKLKADEDSWDYVIDTLLVGSGTSTSIMDWLLEELLRDKLEQWLSYRIRSFSKQDQGIIHVVSGLGFEWALNPILNYGVNINFRDINGWTALHWAARFGREKMIAALIASGASAGAVTDPSSRDPTGKNAASIAASNGHKGLAGYLSEVALTSHLTSLTLKQSDISKGSADLTAEITISSVSNGSLSASEDQISFKDTLDAVRNAAQAAARIQSAFRAHSFRKRRLSEAAIGCDDVDEYGIASNDIHRISAATKLAFRKQGDHHTAALSIQKKYRGWKGRNDFLNFRQKVVKIQALVRGHQVRKNYKVICWAVGILEKVVLRWRRKGSGLRGFRPESEMMNKEGENDSEDILKAFRKQSVEVAIDESLSRVLTMVNSPMARQQYHRVLERFREVKANLVEVSFEAESTCQDDFNNMENRM